MAGLARGRLGAHHGRIGAEALGSLAQCDAVVEGTNGKAT